MSEQPAAGPGVGPEGDDAPGPDEAPVAAPGNSVPARRALVPHRAARLGLAISGTVIVGGILDLFCLLLLPVRFGSHLVPLGPVLVLAANAAVAALASRFAADRIPAQVLLGLAIVLSAAAAVRGPGGDLLVTRDLEGMYLAFVVMACIGAAVPLFRRRSLHLR